MAYKNYSNNWNRGGEYEGDMSKFNEGLFKMMRIHDLQSKINHTRQNPEGFNMDFNVYNYLLIFRLCNQYLQEIISKLKKDEREHVQKFRAQLRKFLGKYPIIKINKGKQIMNEKRLNVFLKALEEYETDLRDLANKHGLGSPSDIDEGL